MNILSGVEVDQSHWGFVDCLSGNHIEWCILLSVNTSLVLLLMSELSYLSPDLSYSL